MRTTKARSDLVYRAAAFLSFDVIAAGALTMGVLLVFSLAVGQLGRAQRDSDVRRTLRLRAETELYLLRAGIVPLPAEGEGVTKRMQRATVETTAMPGADDWDGFVLVRVAACQQVDGHWARVELAAYLPEPEVRR